MLVICKRKITLKDEHTVLCKKTVIRVNLNHDLFLKLFKDFHRDYDKSIPCFHNRTCWPCLLRHHQFWKESWYHQSHGVLLVKVRYWWTRAVSRLCFVFSLEMLLSCVGCPAGSQTGQLEVSEWTLFAPSIGDVTEDGVTASCQPPLPWKETHKRLFERRN